MTAKRGLTGKSHHAMLTVLRRIVQLIHRRNRRCDMAFSMVFMLGIGLAALVAGILLVIFLRR